MKNKSKTRVNARLILDAATAAELMSANPVSIAAEATVKEAATFLAGSGFSAAPVIDDAGRPVGVLSQSDIVVYDREKLECVSAAAAYSAESASPSPSAGHVPAGFEEIEVDPTRVRDIMTPVLFSVLPKTPAHEVIEKMLAHKVHHLFVVGGDGVLVGIISTVDVLRRLQREQERAKNCSDGARGKGVVGFEPW